MFSIVFFLGGETTHHKCPVFSVSVCVTMYAITYIITHFPRDIVYNWLHCTTEFSHDVFSLGRNGSYVGFSDVL